MAYQPFTTNSRKHTDLSIPRILSTKLISFQIFNAKKQLSITKQKQIRKIRRDFASESNGDIVSVTSGILRYG